MKEYQIYIDLSEVCRYLGYGGSSAGRFALDAETEKQINGCIETVKRSAVPRYAYKVFDLNGDLNLRGTALEFSGADAEQWLGECGQCIIFAATIGRNVDALIHRAQISNIADAVILDSCASCAVENLCDQLNRDLEEEYLARGLYLTDRFSPGYGDLPLLLQESILGLLSAEKLLGLTVNSNLILTPVKSVTAVIGISDRPQPKRISGCGNCKMRENCTFRKEGSSCGS